LLNATQRACTNCGYTYAPCNESELALAVAVAATLAAHYQCHNG
jgi:hypothetical protein